MAGNPPAPVYPSHRIGRDPREVRTLASQDYVNYTTFSTECQIFFHFWASQLLGFDFLPPGRRFLTHRDQEVSPTGKPSIAEREGAPTQFDRYSPPKGINAEMDL